MPNPSNVHISGPLTNISIAHFQANLGRYRARSIFPVVGVPHRADQFWVYDQADLLRAQAGRRAPGAPAETGSYGLGTDVFLCERWALGRAIDDPTVRNSDPGIDLPFEAVEFVTGQVELQLEREWCTNFFTSGVWTGASSTGDMTGQAAPATTAANFIQWNNVNSTPIEDIRGELRAVQQRTGYRPNRLALGSAVWDALADHPDVVGRLGDNSLRLVTRSQFAEMLELDGVDVLETVSNNAAHGQPADFGFVAGAHALALYVNPSPRLRAPSAGYSFIWTGFGSPLQGVGIKRYRDERIESDMVEGETWAAFKQVSASLGAFFASAVA